MIISHLVAASENNVIGKHNKIPWHLPNDLKFFKNKSWAMPVIMGRNTYESLDKPLAGRINVVITTKKDWQRNDVTVAHSINEAVKKACESDCNELFIIGGGEIFKQSLNIVNRIYLTRVHTTMEGDVFYPSLDETQWKLISEDPHQADEKHQFAYTFQLWEKLINV
ncbi:MAG TPA: dihydrofolate reductase [Chitinophagaceae bacterium]|nr:dihydrofolate reductase [Chitinophagaceae bacterium]